jgi:hypothetical protein
LSVLLAWHQTVQTSDTHIDGNILCARTRNIAYGTQTDNFAAPNGGIRRLKENQGLAYKKLTQRTHCHSQLYEGPVTCRLPMLLEGYKPWEIHNTVETSLFYSCLGDRMLILKCQSCYMRQSAKHRITVLHCVKSDSSNKQVSILIGKSLQLRCFKVIKTPLNTTKIKRHG